MPPQDKLAESLPDDDTPPITPRIPATAALRPRPSPRPASSAVEISGDLTLAGIKLRRGQIAEAREIADRILRDHPDEAAALELLGDIHLANGHFDMACAAFRNAIKAEPGRPTAEMKLARAALRKKEAADSVGMGAASASSNVSRAGAPVQGGSSRRNIALGLLGSALLPGLGQLVYGQYKKGGIIAAVYFFSIAIGCLLPDTKRFIEQMSAMTTLSHAATSPALPSVSGLFMFFLLIPTLVWLYAVIDISMSAKRAK